MTHAVTRTWGYPIEVFLAATDASCGADAATTPPSGHGRFFIAHGAHNA